MDSASASRKSTTELARGWLLLELGLQGRVAVVTGGSTGIGKAICAALAAEGCDVAFCARGEERLRQAQAELRNLTVRTLVRPLDVTEEGGLEEFIETVASELGRLDILVNNVGGAHHVDEEALRDAFELNLVVAARASRATIPHMRAQGGGSIINVSSIYGRESGASLPYNAAKAAMISHAKNLALQVAADGVRVNSIAPGSIPHPGGSWDRRVQADPDFVAENIPMGRFGTAAEVADVVAFLASERASWVTGSSLNIEGGQSRSNI